MADEESRCRDLDTEWSISQEAFNIIKTHLGTPDIDMFVSKVNRKCDKYVSWRRDPESIAVDAFTLKWTDLNFYAFPPFCMIPRVLHKIIHDKAQGILVVPDWPSQPWYPLVFKLNIEPPLTFQPTVGLLSSPLRSVHPLFKQLSLVAVKLSAKDSG